jgi:hypothetical protein
MVNWAAQAGRVWHVSPAEPIAAVTWLAVQTRFRRPDIATLATRT